MKDVIAVNGKSGFSMMETVVAMGVGAVLLSGSVQYIDIFKKSKESLEAREEERLSDFTHKFYGRKFMEIISSSGLSIPYFKMLIKYKPSGLGNSNVCGQVSGGCFMSMMFRNKKNKDTGEIEEIRKIDGIDSNKIKFDASKSINLFKDEGGSFKEKKLKECCSVNQLSTIRYAKDVRSSELKRYFVGWSLRGTDGEYPLYMMAEDEEADQYFEINTAHGLTPASLDQLSASNTGFTAGYKAMINNYVLMRIPKNRGKIEEEELKKHYKNRYYLFVLPDLPEFYFIAYVADITRCATESGEGDSHNVTAVDRICGPFYTMVAVSSSEGGGDLDFNANLNKVNQNIKPEEKEHDLYLMHLKFIPPPPTDNHRSWGPFSHNVGGWKAKHNVYDLSQEGYWPGQGKKDSPFIPYRHPSVHRSGEPPEERNWPDLEGSTRKDGDSSAPSLALAPHYVVNILASTGTDDTSGGFRSPLVAVPIKFYKIALTKNSDGKKKLTVLELRNEADAGKKGKKNSKERTVLSGLSEDSYVVIARQLGTRRFSTFVHEPGKQKNENNVAENNNGGGNVGDVIRESERPDFTTPPE